MADKSSFTPEEWSRLVASPIVASMAITAADPGGWREAFLAGGEASLKSRPADARDDAIGRLKEKLGDLTMADELHSVAVHNAYHLGKIVALRQRIGAWPPNATTGNS